MYEAALRPPRRGPRPRRRRPPRRRRRGRTPRRASTPRWSSPAATDAAKPKRRRRADDVADSHATLAELAGGQPSSRSGCDRSALASRPAMDGPVCLIVNPHAGAGRALRLLPGVEAELRAQGRRVPRRAHDVDASTRASSPARPATRGEIVAAMGGDGITGAVAGELRDGKGLLAVLPGGRGQRLRAQARDPVRPRRGGDAAADGRGAPDRPRRGRRARRYLGILSAGHRLRRQPDRARDPAARSARPSTSTASLRAIVDAGSQPTGTVTIDGEIARPSPATRSRSPTRASSAAACTSPPTPSSTTACSTSCTIARAAQAPLPARPAEGLQGHATSRIPRSTLVQGREVTFSADRPFTAYADGDPIAELPAHRARRCPARCGCWRRDDAARRRCGRRQGGRHARAHRRARRRHLAARARC